MKSIIDRVLVAGALEILAVFLVSIPLMSAILSLLRREWVIALLQIGIFFALRRLVLSLERKWRPGFRRTQRQ